MPLITISKFLAAATAITQANIVLYLCFLIGVFGNLNGFYIGIGLLNLLICALTLRAVFVPQSSYWWMGLQFIVFGLASLSARFVITDIALFASILLSLAGILALIGARIVGKPDQFYEE